MKCSVTFRHMDSSDAVRQYAEERVEKLTRLIDRGVEAQVTLEANRHEYTAHVELVTDGSLSVRGVHTADGLQAAIDAAVDHILRQVKRYRAKIKNHRPATHPGQRLRQTIYDASAGSGEADGEADKLPRIVKQETVLARPMEVEEAVMQMDLAGTDFMVFTNVASSQVNVVYRLPDGQFGLIEAHPAA